MTTLGWTLSQTKVENRHLKRRSGLHVPLLLIDQINAAALKQCQAERVFSCGSLGFTVLGLPGDDNVVVCVYTSSGGGD